MFLQMQYVFKVLPGLTCCIHSHGILSVTKDGYQMKHRELLKFFFLSKTFL